MEDANRPSWLKICIMIWSWESLALWGMLDAWDNDARSLLILYKLIRYWTTLILRNYNFNLLIYNESLVLQYQDFKWIQFEKSTTDDHNFKTNITTILPDLPQKSLDLWGWLSDKQGNIIQTKVMENIHDHKLKDELLKIMYLMFEIGWMNFKSRLHKTKSVFYILVVIYYLNDM